MIIDQIKQKSQDLWFKDFQKVERVTFRMRGGKMRVKHHLKHSITGHESFRIQHFALWE